MAQINDKDTKTESLMQFVGFNSRDADFLLDKTELSDGQNINLVPSGSITGRKGKTLYGGITGHDTTGVLGLFPYTTVAGVNHFLSVWDTQVYYISSGLWKSAALAAPLTTDLPADAAFFPSTNKFYITNGTDQVVIYDGSTFTRDADFKKGKYIEWFEDRLMVGNITGAENRLWYSDADAITFTSASQYIDFPEAITAQIKYYRKFMVFGEHRIYYLQNFNFTSATASGPEVIVPLPVKFGAIYDRTVQEVNGRLYFLARDEEDQLAVYECDGLNARKVSNLISSTMKSISSTRASSAAAGTYGHKYILAVSTGGTVNDTILVMDTDKRVKDKETGETLPSFLPLYKGMSASCFALFPNATTKASELYYGDYSTGSIYKMETGYYDEGISEEYHTGTDNALVITAATPVRGGQSFQLDETETVSSLAISIHKNSGTTTELTVRIETNDTDKPSGTLANASATGTIAAFTDTTSVWKTVTFSTPFELTADTTYWIVVTHTTETGDSMYHWDSDGSSATYASGNASIYTTNAWTAAATTDAYFIINTKKDIEWWATTAALSFGAPHLDKQLMEQYIVAEATTSANILKIGYASDQYTSFIDHDFNIQQTGAGNTWGSGNWGTGTWGRQTSNKIDEYFFPETSIGSTRRFKFRAYYKGQNEVVFYGWVPSYQIALR